MEKSTQELYESLDIAIDKTAWYLDVTDLTKEDAPVRNLLKRMSTEEAYSQYIKTEIEVAERKIFEANLLLRDLKDNLIRFD